MRVFGTLASAVFRGFFRVVNPFGERWRERTGNEGEIFRGPGANFAFFLSIQTAEVRFYGSEDELSRVDDPKDRLAGTLAIGKVRGFGAPADEADPRAGLAGDFAQGEAFRDTLALVLSIKVRKFGIEMEAAGRRCPADGNWRE
ncbi:hypothetical protein QFZ91_007684 [Paraburkholderia sp. JPY419]